MTMLPQAWMLIAGLVLVFIGLGVDLALTLTGHPVTSVVASVITAGLGIIAHIGLIRLRARLNDATSDKKDGT